MNIHGVTETILPKVKTSLVARVFLQELPNKNSGVVMVPISHATLSELTPIVVDVIGLHKSNTDGPTGWKAFILTLQVILPVGGFTLIVEVLIAPLVGQVVIAIILTAKHRNPIDAVVSNLVIGDVGKAGGHDPNTTSLVTYGERRKPFRFV